jgi:hypothetical protein
MNTWTLLWLGYYNLQCVFNFFSLPHNPATSNDRVEGVQIAQGIHSVVGPMAKLFLLPLDDAPLFIGVDSFGASSMLHSRCVLR